MISFKLARPADAEALTEVQTHTFDDDSRQHGQGERGGPPGYDSVGWQRRIMKQGSYYKILDDDRIIGGIIVFKIGESCYNLGRIYLAPEYQNRGIGAQALAFIEQAIPARRWTLDTPSWAIRNQHFYEKYGYVKVGEEKIPGVDFTGVLYEKMMPA